MLQCLEEPIVSPIRVAASFTTPVVYTYQTAWWTSLKILLLWEHPHVNCCTATTTTVVRLEVHLYWLWKCFYPLLHDWDTQKYHRWQRVPVCSKERVKLST